MKRNLSSGSVRSDGESQLAGYVHDRIAELSQRYVGILSDGREWRLYHYVKDHVELVSELRPTADAPEALVDWLDGILATQDNLTPTPQEVASRLGAESSAHRLDRASLLDLWRRLGAADPSCQLKRRLWARLLRTAFGTNFEDSDDLFVDHTYLVLTAELVAHAVVGFSLSDPNRTPESLVTGAAFHGAQIQNVVEEDFFDWVIEVEGGTSFVRSLARRLDRFNWADVDHDVLKALYESVIDVTERRRLGEYYTPDWLAERMVAEVYADPLNTRALDPSCGSGTFLFHLVRRYLTAAETAGAPLSHSLTDVCNSVYGMDIHPVAVTLARVTFLLAIGSGRLQDPTRPPLSIPVYLGDSLRWQDTDDVLTGSGVRIAVTSSDDGMFPELGDALFFPSRTLADSSTFDRLVAEMSDRASDRPSGSAVPSLAATFRRYGIHPDDRDVLTATFRTMCRLHDQNRNHIWGYYVRNTARPFWMAEPTNKADLLIGNVPWLAFRFMTPAMQRLFRERSLERGLWAGAQLVTHQDLSAYFVVRSVELYLRNRGEFFLLMPFGVLSRQQYAGFRTGRYTSNAVSLEVEFGEPWDLSQVVPPIFPMPAAAIRGTLSMPVDEP